MIAPGDRVRFAASYVVQHPHTATWIGTVMKADMSKAVVRWDRGGEVRYFIDKLKQTKE